MNKCIYIFFISHCIGGLYFYSLCGCCCRCCRKNSKNGSGFKSSNLDHENDKLLIKDINQDTAEKKTPKKIDDNLKNSDISKLKSEQLPLYDNQENFTYPNINNPTSVTKKTQGTIINDFPAPPLIGLKNVGATCYMNATLQCLSQIKKLTDYFKYHDYVNQVIEKYKKEKKQCLTKSFKNLIENLWPSNNNLLDHKNISENNNNTYYAPNEFKEKISTMNELFAGVQPNDAKDLVNFIIMTLHEELNKIPITSNNANTKFFTIDQCNQQDVFKNFFNNFTKENKSIISDIFYGASHTLTRCSGCPQFKHNFESFFFLIFPLEEVRKFKLQELNNMNPMMNMNPMTMNMNQMMNMINMNMNQNLKIQLLNQNKVHILDCFDYNRKAERFFGENAMYCNNCKRQMNSTYQTFLYYAPEILMLVLNRGTGIEFKISLEFYEQLDIRNYFEASNTTGGVYDLIGVVTHMGESGSSGHFIAACKSPIDNRWYKYNDDLVFPVENFKTEILDYAMPYILFYQKKQINMII